MEIGASFSHYFLKYLGLDISDAIEEYKTLGLRWVRLGCYWSSIEKKAKTYDFSEMDKIVNAFDEAGSKIIMTVGMKAPRWPEYFIPKWLTQDVKLLKNGIIGNDDSLISSSVLEFISRCVKRYKHNEAIKVWQIENEPLDQSGEFGMKMSENLLRNEVELVKKIDNTRKTLVTLWGNELTKRKCYKVAGNMADIVGMNIYLRQPVKHFGLLNGYSGPSDSSEEIIKIIEELKKQKKPVWITELQSEPWETDGVVTRKTNPPSFLPSDFEKNLKFGTKLGASVILLWGYEWWYLKKAQGDSRYWDVAKQIINQSTK